MNRQTYSLREIRAGKTFFISYIDLVRPIPAPVVVEFLATSRRGHWPAEGEVYPYRIRPELVEHISKHCRLYRSRRAAKRAVMAELAKWVKSRAN